MNSRAKDLVKRTQTFWTRKLGREVSVEEAEEILQQARLFVRLLIEHATDRWEMTQAATSDVAGGSRGR